MDYPITAFGAKTEPGYDNRLNIQAAIDRCAAEGGGRVVVPRGVFLSGEIALKSHVTLHLDEGSTLKASPHGSAYPSAFTDGGHRGFVTARGCEHIRIGGSGTIDGDCRAWTSREDPYYLYKKEGARRPFLIMPIGCRHVVIEDITIRNGPAWTVVPRGCDDVLIQGIHIYNDLKMPNSDAIDIVSCRDVRILGCHIEAGDDCIVLKTYKESTEYDNPACEGVVVSSCTLVSTSSALVIGCEVHGAIRNVVFNNCVIRNSNRGLSINLSKECDVENVIFSDMVIQTRLFEERWWGHGEAVKISAVPWLEQDAIGRVRNITLRNLLCDAENGILVYGWRPGLIEDVLFDNVRLTIDRHSKWPGGELDLRPTPQDGESYKAGIVPHPLSGFMIKNAARVTLRNCQVTYSDRARQSGEFRHAVAWQDAPELAIEGFRGESASPAHAAIAETIIRKPLDAVEGVQ